MNEYRLEIDLLPLEASKVVISHNEKVLGRAKEVAATFVKAGFAVRHYKITEEPIDEAG